MLPSLDGTNGSNNRLERTASSEDRTVGGKDHTFYAIGKGTGTGAAALAQQGHEAVPRARSGASVGDSLLGKLELRFELLNQGRRMIAVGRARCGQRLDCRM